MSNIAISLSVDTISIGGINCRFQPSPLGQEVVAPTVFARKKPMRFAAHEIGKVPLFPTPVVGEPIVPILPCLTTGTRTYVRKVNPNVYINQFIPVVSGDATVIEGTERPIVLGPFSEDEVYIGLKTKTAT